MKLETILIIISVLANIVTIVSLFIGKNQIINKINISNISNENNNTGGDNITNNFHVYQKVQGTDYLKTEKGKS